MDDLPILLARLADPDHRVADGAEQLLGSVLRSDDVARHQLGTLIAELPASGQLRALRAAGSLKPAERELVDFAVQTAASAEEGALGHAAINSLREVVAASDEARAAVLSRLVDDKSSTVAVAVGALRSAAHIPEVRRRLSPVTDHPQQDVRIAAINTLFDGSVLERVGRQSTEPSLTTGISLYVIPDPEERSAAIDVVQQARGSVLSLPEFAATEDQQRAVDELIHQEILPALDRLEELLRRDTADSTVLVSMRDETRTIAGRAGGTIRGAARAIGSNADKVLTAWNLAEKIVHLVEKIPSI